MKKLFQKVKLDAKFKNAGEGHKLNEERCHGPAGQASTSATPVRQEPMSESQVNAAIAAMERLEKTKPSTTAKRIKLPEDDPRQVQRNEVLTQTQKETNAEPEEYVVEGVKFVSALTGEAIPKSELNKHYRECLLMKLGSDEATNASCLMIRTLNKDREKVDSAIKILTKYIDNAIANEGEEKYRRIRKENKVFSQTVASLEGTEEFLNSIGFKLTSLPSNEKEELYFVLSSEATSGLNEAKTLLLESKPLTSKLFRDTKVYKPPDHAMKFHLPNSFYNLTLEEVRREQGLLSEEVELNQQLRTKAMRERPKSSRKYNYSLIRIRFPEGYILQGTFGVNERLSSVKTFISEHLNLEWLPFTLKTSLGKVVDQDEETLSSLSLVPSVLLNLSWIPDIKSQLNEQGLHPSLKPETLENLVALS